MEWFARSMDENMSVYPGIERCPFLKNINEPTSFSFSSAWNFPIPMRGAKGPIFEDEPNFDMAFRLFHGQDGVVPLSGKSFSNGQNVELEPVTAPFNPLAAKAATISLSSFGFGPGGPFGFDSFTDKWKQQKKQSSNKENSSKSGGNSSHESMSNTWLEMGQCPIAKSYRAVNGVVPLVAKILQPPSGMKLKCPTVIVRARAALARTTLVKNLRPQPLPEKMLAIAMLGMAANVPLGVWREHTKKFSLQWIVAVHAAVPFIAMLRKSVVMPKSAMAITIAASILGQTIGSRAERLRLKSVADKSSGVPTDEPSFGIDNVKNVADKLIWSPLPLLKVATINCSSAKSEDCMINLLKTLQEWCSHIPLAGCQGGEVDTIKALWSNYSSGFVFGTSNVAANNGQILFFPLPAPHRLS